MSRITTSLAVLSIFAALAAHADTATVSKSGSNQIITISGKSQSKAGIAEEIYQTLSKGGASLNRGIEHSQLTGKNIKASVAYLNGAYYNVSMTVEKDSSSAKFTRKSGKIVSIFLVGETAENLFDYATKADLPVIRRMGASTVEGKNFTCNHKVLAPQYKDVAHTCTIAIN